RSFLFDLQPRPSNAAGDPLDGRIRIVLSTSQASTSSVRDLSAGSTRRAGATRFVERERNKSPALKVPLSAPADIAGIIASMQVRLDPKPASRSPAFANPADQVFSQYGDDRRAALSSEYEAYFFAEPHRRRVQDGFQDQGDVEDTLFTGIG